jgi:hypothetical protein
LLFSCFMSASLAYVRVVFAAGATNFTYQDQQLESVFVSFMIRQGITRREVSTHLPVDLANNVLAYLGMSRYRHRSIERLMPHQPSPLRGTAQRPINAADIGAARMYPVMEFVNDDIKEAESGDAGVEQQ